MNEKLEKVKLFIDQGLNALSLNKFSARYVAEADFIQITDESGYPWVSVYAQNIARRSIGGNKKVEGFTVWRTVPSPIGASIDEFDEIKVDDTAHPLEAAEWAVLTVAQLVLEAVDYG